MQAVINLAEALLDRGRQFWEQDLCEEAAETFNRLLSLRGIPKSIAERAQFYLGDIKLSLGQYKKARRHLAAAIATGTGTSETHFLMACALDWDENQNLNEAYQHYRKAVQLEPTQPLYLSAYAMTRIRRRTDAEKVDQEALRFLERAFAASPHDPDVVYNYISGLLEMNLFAEAKLPLARARRHWPGHPAFEELWFEFLELQGNAPERQGSEDQKRSIGNPTILKFPKGGRYPTGRMLRPNARLKSALRSLSREDIRSLGQRWKVHVDSPHRIQEHLLGVLRDPRLIQQQVSRLSIGAQSMLQRLMQSGGKLEISTDQQFDATAELRRCGFAYLTSDSKGQELVIVPADMRKAIRQVLAELN